MPAGRYVRPKTKRSSYKRKPKAKRTPAVTIQSVLHGAALGYLKRKLGLNTEEKFIDVNGTTTATSTLASRIAAPTIPQDITDNGRTGSSLRITRVETRVSISPVLTSTTPSFVRIIQVRHKRSGACPAASVLEVTTSMTSPYNVNHQSLGVEILYDQVLPVCSFDGGVGAYVEWTVNRANMHIIFTTGDTTGVVGNQEEGAITTFWMMDTNFTVAPIFASTSRYYFVDN